MKSGVRLRWLALPGLGALALALLLVACGGPSVGDVEGQVLGMRDPAQNPVLVKGTSVLLAGNRIDCGKRTDRCVVQTDDHGDYRFSDVPAGSYGIAFNPPQEGDARLQPERRQFNVSSGSVERISVVLLADGITAPEVPAELAQQEQGARQNAGMNSLTGNPFFWYFMFNQPWLGGYSRPPVVMYAPGGGTVVPAPNQPARPAAPGRTYSNYGPPGAPGTKPVPIDTTKGVTRPGGSAALPGGGSGTSPGLPDTTKGVARPGQAPSGADDATAPRTGSGSAATRPDQSSSPPRVGAGGGGTAGRSPNSGRISPPRVSRGRR